MNTTPNKCAAQYLLVLDDLLVGFSREAPSSHVLFPLSTSLSFVRWRDGSIALGDSPGSVVAPTWPVTAWASSSFCSTCTAATGEHTLLSFLSFYLSVFQEFCACRVRCSQKFSAMFCPPVRFPRVSVSKSPTPSNLRARLEALISIDLHSSQMHSDHSKLHCLNLMFKFFLAYET